MRGVIVSNIIILIILVLLIGWILPKIFRSEVSYTKSRVNNKEYLVLNLPDKQAAADILGTVYDRIMLLKTYLRSNIDSYPMYRPYIQQFISKITNVDLYENAADGKYTSFTVNKGEEIALCLRSKETGKLHDINLIMYVTLHELAHVACPEMEHTVLFKQIFRFFLVVASNNLHIYVPSNYQIDPHEYCGLTIRENLLAGFLI